MAAVIIFLQGHGLVMILAVFAFVSTMLTALATLLQGMGKTVPGWIGSVSSVLASTLHFLNGNVASGAASAAQVAPSAPPSA